MKRKWKICKNPDCRVKFYREETQNNYSWNQVVFHNRECQAEHYYRDRRQERGCKRSYVHKEAINFQKMHDACNKYIKEARSRLLEGVIVYDSKNMTQEELWALIPPGMGGRR